MDVLEALELPVLVSVPSVLDSELDSGCVEDSVIEAVSDSLLLWTVVRVLTMVELPEVTVVRMALPVWCAPVPVAVASEPVRVTDPPVKVVWPVVV